MAEEQPNIVFFWWDNFGWGELGCYGGGELRGAPTPRIDKLASEGRRLLNFNVEAQCTPSRSAVLTGRHAIRSGTQTIPITGGADGMTRWEVTIAQALSDAGYATGMWGKWHLGSDPEQRSPVDFGFDEAVWCPRTADEVFWTMQSYFPNGDVTAKPYAENKISLEPQVIYSRKKGAKSEVIATYDAEFRAGFDRKITEWACDFMTRSKDAGKPFYLYLPYTQVHVPPIPDPEYAGKSQRGNWADLLTQMDDFTGVVLDKLDELGLADDTIVVWASDNGADSDYRFPAIDPDPAGGQWKGCSGPWRGGLFTALEGSNRTPCIVRWPGKVPAGKASNELVHQVDFFPTLVKAGGGTVPADRQIDGMDMTDFLLGDAEESGRDIILCLQGNRLQAVEWRTWKVHLFHQDDMYSTWTPYNMPLIYNLEWDLHEEHQVGFPHAWIAHPVAAAAGAFLMTLAKEPPIKPGTPDPYAPRQRVSGKHRPAFRSVPSRNTSRRWSSPTARRSNPTTALSTSPGDRGRPRMTESRVVLTRKPNGTAKPAHRPPTAPVAFHVLGKPSGPICNLDCEYCFFLSKEALYPGDRFRMSDELLETYVRQVLESHDGPEVTIAWQGGEPTLMGVAFFRRALELVERYRRPDQNVHHTMQTNGTLLTDEWCALLAAHGFLVGVSIDGPAELHDAYRKDKKGNPTLAKVLRGYQLLRNHDVDTNILCTVNAANQHHPLEVYRYLRDDLGATFIQFIPIVERDNETGFQEGDQVTVRSVDPEAWGLFTIGVFDEWVRRDVGTVFVQLFDAALASWMGLPPAVCVFAETCGNAVALEHNGDLYSCDHFVEPDHLLGNIMTTHMLELVASPQQRAFGDAKRDTLPQYCLDCEVRFACNGECPKNRFTTTPGGEPGLNYLCAGYKAFFTHIDGIMGLMADRLRAGGYADEVMEALRVAGRNDPCLCGSGRKAKHCHQADLALGPAAV